MNGYFQLEIKDRGIYMHMIPPTEGGSQFAMEDVIAYLEYHKITGYNTVEIKRLRERKMKEQLFISAAKILPSQEQVFIHISEDKMKAEAVFYPPFMGEALMNRHEIESSLEAAGVTVGIKKEAIDSFLKHRQYCTPYTIAEGIEPTQGKDASIKYFFDTDLRAKPQLNEDGSVDFHKLNSISHISKGDVLATLTREVRGKAGYMVNGVPIPPRDVKKAKLSFGKNISYTEDQLSIVSDVDGHVTLVGDQVFVADIYEVVADVDAGTGDIEYNGNIEVKGNVRSGFSLKANGNISVKGVVEGATLIAEGDIILACGIQGMGKGTLIAKGNIVTKFIENATVKAGGNITTEAILHSAVSAQEQILVTGKKGFVTGGKVSAFSKIEAKTIGSTMGAETIISVGTDPEEKEMEQQYQADMARLQKELDRLKPIVKRFKVMVKSGSEITPEQFANMKQLVSQYKKSKQQYDDIEAALYKIYEREELEKDARIYVRGRIYPGVKVIISDCRYIVKETIQYCQFRRKGADVKMSSL